MQDGASEEDDVASKDGRCAPAEPLMGLEEDDEDESRGRRPLACGHLNRLQEPPEVTRVRCRGHMPSSEGTGVELASTIWAAPLR